MTSPPAVLDGHRAEQVVNTADLDLDAIVQCRELTHTMMPFIDPTAYMNRTDTIDRMARLCELLGPAVTYWREEIAPLVRTDG